MEKKQRIKVENFKKTTCFVFRVCRLDKPEKVIEVKTSEFKDYYYMLNEVIKELENAGDKYYKIYYQGKKEKWELQK